MIQSNILPTDPNIKIKLIIYCNKFKTSNLVIDYNSLPWLEFCKKITLYINLNIL